MHTLFRPKPLSAGRRAGHLARDSSLYEVAIRHAAGRTVYELRFPVSELGIGPVPGARIGLAVQLNDNDAEGLAARMNWGEGLSPTWMPDQFGLITFAAEKPAESKTNAP